MNKHSKKYRKILRISKCGSGGESYVLNADQAGSDIVIKCPNDAEYIDGAKDETHLIEFLYDHTEATIYTV